MVATLLVEAGVRVALTAAPAVPVTIGNSARLQPKLKARRVRLRLAARLVIGASGFVGILGVFIGWLTWVDTEVAGAYGTALSYDVSVVRAPWASVKTKSG